MLELKILSIYVLLILNLVSIAVVFGGFVMWVSGLLMICPISKLAKNLMKLSRVSTIDFDRRVYTLGHG